MNFKTTLVMLVLLAAIAGAYLWMSSAGPRGASPQESLPDTLVTGREFQSITIQQQDQTLTLENQEGQWWQTQPVRFPVTGETVETLVNAGLSLVPRKVFSYDDESATIAPGEALSTLGLEPPRATVTYLSDTGTHQLLLGTYSVAGSAYLQLNGDERVYLVDPTLHNAVLNADPKSWRPQTLPTLDANRVNRITLTGGPQDLNLTRAEDGWSLAPDGGERADDELVTRLAMMAQHLKPLSYVSDAPDALTQYGLAEPRATLTTADATGARQTLRLGQDADLGGTSVYATWSDTDEASPVVFVLPADPINELPRITADLLRDPRVVTASPGTIRGQLVNRVGRDTVEINQSPDGQGLAFVEPETGYDPDIQRASRWLTTLTRVEPTGHVRAPREAQAPIALIELRLTGGRSEYVRLYADRDGREDVLLAVRESETVAALVPSEQVAPLLAPVVTLRDRNLPDVGPIEELRLTRDDGEAFNFALDPQQGWLPQNDDFTDQWHADRFKELGDWVASPRVRSWTALPELPRGPTARLSLGQGKPAYVVNVDQQLGQRTDLPGVFRLPEVIAPLFGEEYRQKLVLPYRPDQITRVTLGIESNPDSPNLPPAATISRNPQGVFVDAQGNRFDNQAQCAALLNTLAGLSAKRIIPARLPEQRQPPIRFWELATDDGQTHRLQRDNLGVWSLNDLTFFIEAEDDKLLKQLDTAWGKALVSP
ncbi:DUF4340 domain-containing protein [Algisphaera agarilytica]|uniref:DUF4340 domain-containing protein n=1 Tax=Algisphaera agarilytica TaxID=1385975 RepID=A0A7X0H9Y0_9BACT|nr:DUF4340 domain-containing protein [Algisphaera agarilytica]MBB6430881.1 hypothetical protein [Algisphaera agarilytica]